MAKGSGGINTRVTYNRFPSIAAKITPMADLVCAKAAQDIQAHAQTSMTGGGPSAPGSPPAVDTGMLKSSIKVTKRGMASYRVTVGAEYGVYLEYGTVNMEPRPFMGPAVDAVNPAFQAALKRALKGLA